MSGKPNIRLNKVLRELNIATDTAVQLLENNGHIIAPIPNTIITHEQYQILSSHYKDFKPKKRVEASLPLEKNKITPIYLKSLDGNVKKIKRKNVNKTKSNLKPIDTRIGLLIKNKKEKPSGNRPQTKKVVERPKKKTEKSKKFITKKRPEAAELLQKMENLCVGQRLKKISIVLGIPEEEIWQLGRTVMPNCTLETRISETDFDNFKPNLLSYLQDLLEKLPETITHEKRKNCRNYKPSVYNKTSIYYDFVRIIYTNM